jgi:hypothetical protein
MRDDSDGVGKTHYNSCRSNTTIGADPFHLKILV